MTSSERPSPNFDDRPPDTPVDMVVLHYTGMESAAAALARLCDPEARVSAHYVIGEDGAVVSLVAEDQRAWHAGAAFWRGQTDINARSIGIELVNPGHEFGYRPFAPAQMAALIDLGREFVARHRIPPARVLGHSDVAPGRKQDPGELFDWPALAEAGLGLWPGDAPADTAQGGGKAGAETGPEPGTSDLAIAATQRHMCEFGYDIAVTGTLDPASRKVVAAFQRHFRPALIDGAIDAETAWLIRALCRLAGDEAGA